MKPAIAVLGSSNPSQASGSTGCGNTSPTLASGAARTWGVPGPSTTRELGKQTVQKAGYATDGSEGNNQVVGLLDVFATML